MAHRSRLDDPAVLETLVQQYSAPATLLGTGA